MTGRIHTLDGIRGYAALSVLIYHAIQGLDPKMIEQVLLRSFWDLDTTYQVWTKFWMTLFNGESAVIMFFLLSGCVLIVSLDRDFQRSTPLRTALAFLVRRVLRIYPAVIASVMAIVAVVWLHALLVPTMPFPFTPSHILQNLTLYSPEVNGATWTLLIEMLAVPFLIATGYFHWRYGWPALIVFLIYALIAKDENTLAFGNRWTALYLFYFAFGCMVPYGIGQWAARMAEKIGWRPLLVGFIFVRPLLPFGFEINLLQAILGFMFLSLVYHRPPERLGAFLMRPVSQFLGRVSYGFYLWNVVFIVLLGRTTAFAPDFFARHAVEIGLVASVPIALMTAALADLSDRWIEQPCIRLGRRISRHIMASREAPDAALALPERAGA